MNLNTRSSVFDLDKFFNGHTLHSSPTRKTSTQFAPAVDIYEKDDSYELVAELAGIAKDAISVTVEESILTIEADNSPSKDDENSGKALRRERRFGKFSRSFNLGQDIEQTEIKASFKDGLLILSVPKVKETVVTPRQIEIH